MTHHIKYHNEGEWVRECALAFENKKSNNIVVNLN